MSLIETLISEAKLEANRANAQKSTGPTTEEGKKRSSINARRHGLTGQFQAFSEEDRVAFEKHCYELVAEFRPQGARERILAVAIAEDHWRLSRARAIENNIFAVHLSGELGDSVEAARPEVHTSATHAKTWLQEAHSIQLLTLYESRIRRTIEKNEKQLAELQAARQESLESDIRKAILLTQLAEFKGETYDPAEDFPTMPTEGECPTYPGDCGQLNEDGCPAYPGEMHSTRNTGGQLNEDGCRTYPGGCGQPGNAPGQVNGFVFSNARIARRRDLDKRLAEALHHAKNGWRKPNSTETPLAQKPKAA